MFFMSFMSLIYVSYACSFTIVKFFFLKYMGNKACTLDDYCILPLKVSHGQYAAAEYQYLKIILDDQGKCNSDTTVYKGRLLPSAKRLPD